MRRQVSLVNWGSTSCGCRRDSASTLTSSIERPVVRVCVDGAFFLACACMNPHAQRNTQRDACRPSHVPYSQSHHCAMSHVQRLHVHVGIWNVFKGKRAHFRSKT